MEILKDDVLELEITGTGINGEGVGRVEGLVVFVPFAIPGERVRAKVISVNKSYARALMSELLVASPARVEPFCPAFYHCGGCDLQHMSYPAQLLLKQTAVSDCFNRQHKLNVEVAPCVPSPSTQGYRNKLQLPVAMRKGKVIAGFYSERTHRVVGIDSCPLSYWSGSVIRAVTDWANEYGITAYDEESQNGLLRHITAREVDKRLMITLVVTSLRVPFADKLIKNLDKHFKDYSLFFNLNNKNTNVIMGDKLELVKGAPALVGSVQGVKFELTPLSFAQVNPKVMSLIYESVLDQIDEGSVVIDAYSGIGILSCLAARKASRVFGIEIVKEAVRDADKTTQQNGLTDKTTNICGDCAVELPKLVKSLKTNGGIANAAETKGESTDFFDGKSDGCNLSAYDKNEKTCDGARNICNCDKDEEACDSLQAANQSNKNVLQNSNLYSDGENAEENITVILDPPRKGCDNSVLDAVLSAAPNKIIYISCNPATLARDLERLTADKSYAILSATPYDMFPHTGHVETLVSLVLKDKKD